VGRFLAVPRPGARPYDAALAVKYGDAVENSYGTMDEIVGDGER
jgi:hypothetical protein